MADLGFLSFAFIAGIFAFFSPCAVVLLPAYVSYFISRHSNEDSSSISLLLYGSLLSFFSILGFFTVFGISGFLVIAFGQFIKKAIPYVAVITGSILILFGLLILFGKHITLKLPAVKFRHDKSISIKKTYSFIEPYLFGISYAVAALGCVFPLFLTVVLQGIIAQSYLDAVYYILAYIAGISLLMLAAIFISVFAQKFIAAKLNAILPYIEKAAGIILILAGSYMIYYQSAYF